MQPWSIAIALLIAVLAGAAIPLMVQLWMTLHAARRVAERMDRVTARLEEGDRLDEIVAALDGVTSAARQVGNGVKIASAVGAAIGPAAAAAIQSWRASSPAASDDEAAAAPRDGVAAHQPNPAAEART